ncbi:type IX secretion system anionic LPS delivery protein PorZ [Chitinophagaceae bacterium MMS25-I14]
MNKTFFTVASALLLTVSATAQEKPIGYWRSHLAYNTAKSIATDGSTIFTATDLSFFTYDVIGKEITPYSKLDGMADIQMSYIGHDALTGTTILAYSNSNIDLFRNNRFYGIPYLKLENVNGSKTINHIYTENGLAYLSTGIGVVVLNLAKDSGEVKETYAFSQNSQTIPTFGFGAAGGYFYAATGAGLYRSPKTNPNLQIQATWQKIGGTQAFSGLATMNGKVFVTGADSLFAVNNDTLTFLYKSGGKTNHIDSGSNKIYISQNDGKIKMMDTGYHFTDSMQVGMPRQVLELSDGSVWIADDFGGLSQRNQGSDVTHYIPSGPGAAATYGIYANNKEVWVAHGSYNDLFQYSGSLQGMSSFIDETWKSYNAYNFGPLNNVHDLVTITKNPVDGSIWAGSLQNGLFILKTDGTSQLLNQGGPLESKANEPTVVPVSKIVPDQYGNMWITQLGAQDELAVQTTDGSWHHFTTPFAREYPHGALGLVIDNSNQKWFFSPSVNSASTVLVYNDNYTIDDPSDDTYTILSGSASGLAGSRVYSIACDKNGSVWVGTDDGISIFSCADQVISGGCKGELRVVQYDVAAGLLFQTQQVKCIAVDGANRKWVGTTNGLWLLSPEADKQIYKFNTDNSPLPSNSINTISIDGVTGDVYVGTDLGMVSYRSTATDGGTTNENVLTFPNPVPHGYTGTIAVRGLVENADVRFTDISGQLVYRTKALGGQAVWNGLDYTGRRPQSGVYLIFITNKDGSQTHVGKMVFME